MFIRNKQESNIFCIEVDRDVVIKDFLLDDMNFSVRSISKIKREKRITVNGEYRKPSMVVKKGEIIKIDFCEEKSNFKPQNLDVDVIYEDFDVVVLDKPPYMVVHPTKSHYENTLANHMAWYVDYKNEEYRIRFVNRLDMNTSGLVVVAKSAYSHHILSLDMGTNDIKKEYIAIVDGIVEQDFGTINAPIGRPSMDSIVREVRDDGQDSITHYEVLERLDNATVLKLVLETGRTHQIRVHLNHINHGIIGDELYGVVDDTLINRQALHAYRLTFSQPRMKDKVEVVSKLPQDMKDLIKKLGGCRYDY